MKIVTFNVNGLRPRVAQHGSLLRLLAALDADIICFQETKVSRQDLSVDLTMAEGYEVFFSCNRNSNRGRSGYSGVATFCRVRSAFSSNEVTLPLGAEEGFTGLLDCPRKPERTSPHLIEAPVKIEGLEITDEELMKVDSEGRCIVTDHGHFVLFNIYGPRAEEDDEERQHFKLVFFKILQKRWEFLLAQGKRVFVVGDLNIAPAAIDRCDAPPDFEKNMFRKWLRSLLTECQGPFCDVFRLKNPGRKEAYTCFSQRIGAEEFNYGSRIDHILIAGSCLHEQHNVEGHNFFGCHVVECDIMSHFRRGNSGNAPRWKGGRSSKLEGSDHVPVYAILRDIPDVPIHNTPSLAVRYVPEVRGLQQTIVSFLRKEQVSSSTTGIGYSKNETETCHECIASSQDCGEITEQDMTAGVSEFFSDQSLPNLCSGQKASQSANEDSTIKFTMSSLLNSKTRKTKSLSDCTLKMQKTTQHSTCSQLTLKSFFKRPKTAHADEAVSSNNICFQNETGKASEDMPYMPEQPKDMNERDAEYKCEISEASTNSNTQDQDHTNLSFPLKREKDNDAVLEWQRIQQKMKMTLPLCKGHGEPCVARSVKKEGPNRGRLFYVCTRAQGPASNPEANCGFFQWGSLKTKEKLR